MELISQLSIFKELIGETTDSDTLLQFYLDCASDIICDIRYTTAIEPKYLTHQIKIAMELYSKRGAEGQTSHAENGLSRGYESADVSPSLLNQITPFVRTPFSTIRVIE